MADHTTIGQIQGIPHENEQNAIFETSTGAALAAILDTGKFGGRTNGEIWVKSSIATTFKIYGSVVGDDDPLRWRETSEIELTGAGESHIGFFNAYRFIKVETVDVGNHEIEIVTSR